MKKDIFLYPHNQRTYEEVMGFLKENDFKGSKAAICNCTGIGKSFVLMKVMQTFIEMGKTNILLLAPTWEIISQFENEDCFPDYYENIRIYKDIYPSLMIKNRKNIKEIEVLNLNPNKTKERFKNIITKNENFDFDLIIFDELHRTGAKEWSKAINLIQEIFPNACLLGASATPRRYDQKDQVDDQVDIMFDGHRCGNISLYKALEAKLLPLPTYVTTMYQLTNELQKKINYINEEKLLSKEQKAILLDEIEESKINWEKSYGYEKTLNYFFKNSLNKKKPVKIIIFCKNEEHIKEIRKSFDPIFKKIFLKEGEAKNLTLNNFTVKNKIENFEYFRDVTTPNTAHVLYVIDKFNEGLHVKGLNSIIMLRNTESENVYFQQLGRCLAIDGDSHPLIIDFINNFNNFSTVKNLWNSLLETTTIERENNNGYNWSDRDMTVKFYNEAQNALDLFEKIDKSTKEALTVEYKGEKNTIIYFVKKYNKNIFQVKSKLESGLSFETALDLADYVRDGLFYYDGETEKLKYHCKKHGKNYKLMEHRIFELHMSIEEAFNFKAK